MIKVAIVGNIASGKTTVEKILQKFGYKVFDTDIMAHEILSNSLEIFEYFGTHDRAQIAQEVFRDKEKLMYLESIIHPKVKEEIQKIFKNDYPIVFISVPQLFEANMENMFDKIIYLTADEKIRIERLIKRNNFTKEEAIMRINAQINIGKAEKSDFVIDNNSDLQSLEYKIKEILSILIG